MSENPEKIKDLQHSFDSFLWRCVTQIQINWDSGERSKALEEALGLVIYLPVNVKKHLQVERDKIQKLMNNAFNVESSDFQTTMLLRNKQLDKISTYYFPRFMDAMITLLDKRGYLERGLLAAPKYANPKKPLGAEQ
jgi:hypothetical protein